MADPTDSPFTNEGMGDRGGAARHPQKPTREQDERWPEEGFGDRGGAARKRVIEGIPDQGKEPQETHGFWQSTPSDDPAGYGGGRQRAEQFNDESFGETGWGGARGSTGTPSGQEQPAAESAEMPKGAKVVPDSPKWDERFARENSDKYGQAGGERIEQRGGAQSQAGHETKEEENVGDPKNISPRGAYGARDTDKE